MFNYFITNGLVKIPVEDFSLVKKETTVIDPTSAKIHLEYPNGVIMDCIVRFNGADITINRELIQKDDGNYYLKED